MATNVCIVRHVREPNDRRRLGLLQGMICFELLLHVAAIGVRGIAREWHMRESFKMPRSGRRKSAKAKDLETPFFSRLGRASCSQLVAGPLSGHGFQLRHNGRELLAAAAQDGLAEVVALHTKPFESDCHVGLALWRHLVPA